MYSPWLHISDGPLENILLFAFGILYRLQGIKFVSLHRDGRQDLTRHDSGRILSRLRGSQELDYTDRMAYTLHTIRANRSICDHTYHVEISPGDRGKVDVAILAFE